MPEIHDILRHTPVSYYEILQVSRDASDKDVQRAYHRLAKIFHPDHNREERKLAELRFKLINEAYANLKTKEKRTAYAKILKKDKKITWRGRAGNDNRKTQTVQTAQNGWFLASFSRLLWPARENK